MLTGEVAGDRYSLAKDARGRLIQLDAFLRALELMSGPGHPDFRTTADLLAGRLNDYGNLPVPSHQRRFLMKRLRDLTPDSPALPMLAAEELSAAWLESRPVEDTALVISPFELPGSWLTGGGKAETARLRPTLLSHVWQMTLPEGRGTVLFTQDGLVAEVEELAREQSMPPEVSVRVLPPGSEPDPDALLPSLAAGAPLIGWRLGLVTEGGKLFAGAAGRQATVYLWTGVLFIAGIAALAALVARHIVQQVRVARLKNDLVATVTHELKTPLSSMRMLVDTLLDGHYRDDEEKTREYLELIAKENARLSRLIDHFLTFSRMERNKKAFQFEIVPPGRIVEQAMEAIGERLASAGFEVNTEIDADLPDVSADPDAMVTVLLNLLDNAYKYSDEDRRVSVRAFRRNHGVSIRVEDAGIGMAPRTLKRVFDRFYQADRSLNRRTGGCGLGLSIVDFVVRAHSGTIDVESRPGEGSTFTVTLPGGTR
jgi:signal transduction histidine kinase